MRLRLLVDRYREFFEAGGQAATPAADQDRQFRLAVRVSQFVEQLLRFVDGFLNRSPDPFA
ncbi:MAG TPA: hypothetical protein VJ838_12375 [Gaiellaceae bacterium]|nr:hypothetical protein [Gaiellaceae bacterium]